uniref:SF4 helicase domain-containing protein n=1 Tax=Acrobeloides nanus TaxID=290746 RepID=A0A914BZC2_9BILA
MAYQPLRRYDEPEYGSLTSRHHLSPGRSTFRRRQSLSPNPQLQQTQGKGRIVGFPDFPSTSEDDNPRSDEDALALEELRQVKGTADMEELDSDLYDRVSYLNLMSRQEERNRFRRIEESERLRRLQENAEKISSRGTREVREEFEEPERFGPGTSRPVNTVVSFPLDPTIRQIWADAIDLNEIRNVEDQAEFRSLKIQLGIDRITSETLTRYHIKGHMDSYDQPAICYPRYRGPSGRTRTPIGLKVIRRVGDKLEKENYPEVEEKGKLIRFSGIFGYHMVTPADRRVILTTNERDSLAVYDATGGMLCLALPNAERVDHAVLPYLEDFDTVYLWFPLIHEKYAKDYTTYLNAARCFIINKKERPIELIREDRPRDINWALKEAVRWKRFDVLNNYLRGFRPKELTVLTGGTGIGKTTFVCEYAMDLFTQGVRTLFCSFEMPEEKVLKWMMIQYAGPSHVRSLARTRTYHNGMKLPLHRVDHHPSVELWLDRFGRTKDELIIMKTEEFRDKSINAIANSIREQVISGNIQHVVIDNLQFVVGLSTLHKENLSFMERVNLQDRFVGLLRSIASDFGPHITLVVHPRKSAVDESLNVQDVAGSARITQEADNLLVIQRRRDDVDKRKYRKFLYILKNRYGRKLVESDQLELVFQPATYTHTLVDYTQEK